MVIQEGANGMIFDDVDNWEKVEDKITHTYIINVYRDNKLVGQVPYNVKTTVLMWDYDIHYDEPNSGRGHRA